jgi:release factor glutamine methyltransferase
VREDEFAEAAYARGHGSFMGLDLFVAKGSLVPRPETEILARAALDLLATGAGDLGPEPKVIDMCTGSGNLACAIAANVPTARVWALDLSEECVELARRNIESLELERRVTVLQGDLFAPLTDPALHGTVDLVVCNPPYISSARLSEREDLAGEPALAFDGGPYGLSIHQRVSRDALNFLRPGGSLAFEFGLGQERQLGIVVQRARGYESPRLVNDAEGHPRVLVAKRRSPSA